MKCLSCKSAEVEQIFELPKGMDDVMDDYYFFICPSCQTVEKIHYYTYEAMMDYEEEMA